MAGRYPTHDDFATVIAHLRAAPADGTTSVADVHGAVSNVPITKLRVIIMALTHDGLLRQRRGGRFEIRPRLRTAPVDPLAAIYDERRQRDQTRLEQMVVYAQTALCRTRVLLDALGESVDWTQCDSCDNCRGIARRAEAVAEGAA
jgi:ATP-dependent DNA helicase RecQ